MNAAYPLAMAVFLLQPGASPKIPAAAAAFDEASTPLPPWLTPDQLVECATVLADGIRVSLLHDPADEAGLIRMPVLLNETRLPVPDSDAWARAIGRAVAIRTGARVRILDASAPEALQARAVPSRIVITQAAPDDGRADAVIALRVGPPGGNAERTLAQYLVREAFTESEQPDRIVDVADADLDEFDYQTSISLENGEVRFEEEDLAEDVYVTVETLSTSESDSLRVRIEFVAPERSVRTPVQLFFLRDGEVVRTFRVQPLSLRRGRPKTIEFDSTLPADRFVLYFPD